MKGTGPSYRDVIVGASIALLAACGGTDPISASGSGAKSFQSTYQEVAAPAVDDEAPSPRLTTRVITADVEHNETTKIVRVREYSLPAGQIATDSIMTGPDGNLWFTEWRAIARLTAMSGQIRATKLRSWQADPGLLTIGPDGNIWANTAETGPPLSCDRAVRPLRTRYEIYRVTPDGELTSFPLPADTDEYPTRLLKVGSTLYFGLPVLVAPHGDEEERNLLATISPDGTVKEIAVIPHSRSTGNSYIGALHTPGPEIWLYDYEGGIHVCSTASRCFFKLSEHPCKYVGNLEGTVLTYSPADQDVYIDDQNTWTILRYALDGKKLREFRRVAFARGSGSIAYYHGSILIALGGDDKARPNLGRLTPSGNYSEFSLPFVGPTAAVSAVTGGPDGHLWYLRGQHVGEILSSI